MTESSVEQRVADRRVIHLGKKFLIATVGLPAAGKSQAIHYLLELIAQAGFQSTVISTNKILKYFLDQEGLADSRNNFRELFLRKERALGPFWLADYVTTAIHESSNGLVVWDSPRTGADYERWQEFEEEVKTGLFLKSPAETRWERGRKRKQKAGEDTISLEEFEAQEKAPNEAKVLWIGEQMPYSINNGPDCTNEMLAEAVLNFWKEQLPFVSARLST